LFHAKITVTLRSSILDPQGKAIEQGIHSMGYSAISRVRIGKHIEFDVQTDDRKEAERMIREACEKLLSNPIMEDFTFNLEPVKQSAHV